MKMQFALGFITAILMVILVVPYVYKRWQLQKVKIIDNYARIVDMVETTKDTLYYYQVVPEEKFLYISPSTDNVLGKGFIENAYLSPELCIKDIHPDDYEMLRKKINGEIDYSQSIVQRWKANTGEYIWFEEYTTPIYENGVLIALKGVLRNIDEKVELNEKLRYQLYHDNLTDIYNREYFESVFTKYNEEVNVSIAIAVCDLDDLKYTNDNYGHKIGDMLIQETAKILKKFASDIVIVSRIGGDEFVIILIDTSENQLNQLMSDIIAEIVAYNKGGTQAVIKLSIGFSYAPCSIEKMEELFSQADKNMYIDKANRKNTLMPS